MRRDFKKLVILLLLPLVFLSGCKKKKPPLPPPQQQAPTITEPEPQPPVQQPPVEQPPAQPPVVPPQQQPPTTATKPKPKTHKRHVAKKPAPAPEQKNKTVVKEGGETAPNGQLSAGIPQDEVTQQRQTTAQLRLTTEKNLGGINRQLSSDEQAMVQKIRTYLAQSRAADNDGDTERAYNLAVKAHLLADELSRH